MVGPQSRGFPRAVRSRHLEFQSSSASFCLQTPAEPLSVFRNRHKAPKTTVMWSTLYMSRPLVGGIIAATACLSATLYIQSATEYKDGTKGTAIARSRLRSTSSTVSELPSEENPYPPDIFPGGRDVDTPHGTIKVFEWGPDSGEKVLLMHGIGTPCVALGDMAKRLVAKGYRVMLFGESRL